MIAVGFGYVVAVGVRYGAVFRLGDHTGPLPRAEKVIEWPVGAVAQCGPGDSGVAEDRLGGDVDVRRPVRITGDGALLARVEDPPAPAATSGLDGIAVQADHVGGRVVAGDQKDLLGTGEGVTQRGRVLVGALPHAYAAVGEVLRLGGVATLTPIRSAGMRLRRCSTMAPPSPPVAPVTTIMCSTFRAPTVSVSVVGGSRKLTMRVSFLRLRP
ncbi:hypothetical protein TPA0909_00390 [Streptomyces albus]|nr:hypothetical protein TPA0909_00390 [Streptomyces albus]